MDVMRAGFLVVGSVRTSGCLSYRTEEYSETIDGVALDADWKTRKHIANVDEQRAMWRTRAAAMGRLWSVGRRIEGMGTYVPATARADLDDVLREIRAMCESHNTAATTTSVEPVFKVFVIQSDDTDIARSIYADALGALDAMARAVAAADIGGLRAAIRAAARVNLAMPDEQAAAMTGAMDDARRAARKAAREIAEAAERNGGADAIARRILAEVPIEAARAVIEEAAAPLAASAMALAADVRVVEAGAAMAADVAMDARSIDASAALALSVGADARAVE